MYKSFCSDPGECGFLTHSGAHENVVVNHTLLHQESFYVCIVFEGDSMIYVRPGLHLSIWVCTSQWHM